MHPVADCARGRRQRRAPPPRPACLHRAPDGPRTLTRQHPAACHHVRPGCSCGNTGTLSDLLRRWVRERGSQGRLLALSSTRSVLPHSPCPKSRSALWSPQPTLTSRHPDPARFFAFVDGLSPRRCTAVGGREISAGLPSR